MGTYCLFYTEERAAGQGIFRILSPGQGINFSLSSSIKADLHGTIFVTIVIKIRDDFPHEIHDDFVSDLH